MKIKLILSLALLYSASNLFGQSNCSRFYPMEEGSSFEYTSYNKKGKTEGVTNYTIREVSSAGGSTMATFDLKYTDDKGKEIFNSDYNITCTGDGIKIDYKSLFPSQMMKQYEDMGVEMDLSGSDITLPNNLTVGEQMDDANVTMKMSMAGMNMSVTVDQTNRKVEKKESITTPAGTFDCYLITETMNSKAMGASQEFNNKLWLSEGVGMVKQETYKKNGDLMSRMELTKFNK